MAKFPSISEKLLFLMKARKVSGVAAELIARVDNLPDNESRKRKLLLFVKSDTHFIIIITGMWNTVGIK